MTYVNKLYQKWVTNPTLDDALRKELLAIKDNDKAIEDRFYKDLEFGTGGLRGVIGAGINRMNIYTVSKATKGIGDFIVSLGKEAKQRGVVIAYDCRHMSQEFAKQTALVLCAMGIKAYLFDDLRTTPELSFAVRYLGAQAGVVITASHNPSEYNGYKVYWQDGGQITDQLAKELITKINKVDDCFCIQVANEREVIENQSLQYIGEEIDQAYIEKVKTISLDSSEKNIITVYTPLHGTGLIPIRRVLKELHYNHVHILESQKNPDGSFPTVKSPNPEEPEALSLAIEYAAQVNADLVLGTDPDCDRIGIAVRDSNGCYRLINGNQTGALLVNYILSKKKGKLTGNDVVIKTIVTSDLGGVIAKKYGIKVEETLTGFKYIGEKIKEFESTDDNFIFGYEESYGYLAGTFVRDKDAVMAAMLICEMANDYKEHGLTLIDALEDIYKEHGYYQEQLQSITLTGIEGTARIGRIMDCFRTNPSITIEGFAISSINDYKTSISHNLTNNSKKIIQLPSSNVLKYISDDGSWIALRPSGTEPKLKIYYSVVEKKSDILKHRLDIVMNSIGTIIQSIV